MKKSNTYGTALGYFTDENWVNHKGEYKPTSLDEQKKNADFLVMAIDNKYTLWANNGKELKTSRSIKKVNEKIFIVTDKAFDEIKKTFNVMYDL